MTNEERQQARVAYVQSIMANDPTRFMTDKQVGEWDKAARASASIGPDYDYSVRQSSPDARGHLGDAGKLPNHPTFSDHSVYSGLAGAVGGRWVGSKFYPTTQQQYDDSAKTRQWMVNNGHTDGDIYIGPDGRPLQPTSGLR
jgi:hypothetical protein